MLIGELAYQAGVSARALRHYEERGLLPTTRDANGYRIYAESDVARVLQIKAMIEAGLTTRSVRRYLDCARTGEAGVWLELCPDLRSEIDAIAGRIDQQRDSLARTKTRLCAIAPSDPLVG